HYRHSGQHGVSQQTASGLGRAARDHRAARSAAPAETRVPPAMEIGSVMRRRLSCVCVFLLAACAFAQPRKTVFLITDAEGVAGVCRQDQTDPKDQEMRQLLTGEINAAVNGLYQGGAEDVIVWDGHDGSQTLSALTIHPRSKLIIGDLSVAMTLERNYAAVGFVGQH